MTVVSVPDADPGGLARTIAVFKIGGSVLTGRQAFRRVAAFIGDRLAEAAASAW